MINLILAEEVPHFQFVTVQFASSPQHYTYKTNLELKEGDFVVVNAPSGLTVVTVTSLNVEVTPSHKYAIKWIVDVVDSSNYKSMLKLEKGLMTEDGVSRL